MAFKNLRLSYKMMLRRVRRYVIGGKKKKKEEEQSWMMPGVSHGYHVVELEDNKNSPFVDTDKVVAQREDIEEHELWFFGVFDSTTADGVSHYLQTHFFDKNKLKETQMRSRSKETMRKAHMNARAKVRETEEEEEEDEKWELGSASAIVIDGEKIVVADMGEYKVVVCRDGKAYQINRKQHNNLRRHWSRTFIPGAFRKVKVRLIGRESGYRRAAKASKVSEVTVGYERIDRDTTEFVILASIGIWEVMKHQEAVNLIRHIEDPQEAAECLAKEALIRMSKKNISCLIIRFD